MTNEQREEAQKIMRELMVFMSDFNDLQKTFSRLQNDAKVLYEQLDNRLDDG